MSDIPRQTKNVLESFLRMLDQTDSGIRAHVARYAKSYVNDARASTRAVARRILKAADE